jgi:hypothetical protein
MHGPHGHLSPLGNRRAALVLGLRMLSGATGLGALLSACASTSLPPPVIAAEAGSPTTPLLRLSPASFGGSLSLLQQLTVETRGRTHRFDVVLEVDDEAVRLAVLNLGQTVARLAWDGTHLVESRAAGWPAAVRGERVLSDLQLMLWPVAEIAAALPAGWTIAGDEALQRKLSQGAETVATVRRVSSTVSELDQLREAYRIHVESRPWGASP